MLSDSDKAGITFYPVDLCPPGVYINTHVLIFEGAGDLLFKDSRNFRLLDVDRKYNCVTEFRKIDFGLFRRNLNPRRFDEFTSRIAMLINKPTLVVCWKDINGGDDGPGKSEYAEQLSEALLLRVSPRNCSLLPIMVLQITRVPIITGI